MGRTWAFSEISFFTGFHALSDEYVKTECIWTALGIPGTNHSGISSEPDRQQAEKEKAIEQQKIREIFEDRYGEIRSFRFYAEEKGRYIIFVQMKGRPQVYTVKKIAGSEFRYREEFFLYAYVDGEFIDLEEAYNNGLFSKETIAEAVRVHKKDANVPD